MGNALSRFLAALLFLILPVFFKATTNLPGIHLLGNEPLSGGSWIKDSGCSSLPLSFTCSPGGYAWHGNKSCLRPYLDGEAACQKLTESGIHKIAFVGDSFIRHAYEGLALILSRDYQTGALTDQGAQNSACHGEGQFEEKRCRHYVRQYIIACGGNVHLQLYYGAWPRLTEEHGSYDAVIWGGGNHPIDQRSYDTRWGIHDATLVEEHIFGPVCQNSSILWLPVPYKSDQSPRLFWLSMHARLSGTDDESESAMAIYALESLNSIRRKCGAVEGIDVFNMTKALIRQIADEARQMTHDSAHWSRAVNILKGQAILYSISDPVANCV